MQTDSIAAHLGCRKCLAAPQSMMCCLAGQPRQTELRCRSSWSSKLPSQCPDVFLLYTGDPPALGPPTDPLLQIRCLNRCIE